jgi:hypothetical protein
MMQLIVTYLTQVVSLGHFKTLENTINGLFRKLDFIQVFFFLRSSAEYYTWSYEH